MWEIPSASSSFAMCPLCPSCPSPPLQSVWMNVSSLNPWLSDFHAVRVSGSSGCFCFSIGCYPSFGCARKQSVSTYASILVRTSVFRVLKTKSIEEVLWEDLNRIFISFLLLYQNEIYSLNFFCAWVWLATMAGMH